MVNCACAFSQSEWGNILNESRGGIKRSRLIRSGDQQDVRYPLKFMGNKVVIIMNC